MTSLSDRPNLRIAVAGATGFVGRALLETLKNDHNVIGLSRQPVQSSGNIEWRQCDLFSLKNTESALRDCDIAIYLVHSMLPTARLTQGSFDDLDLLNADNFGKAARKNRVKRIIYLGGLLPENGGLSPHLRSRLEVEDVLSSFGIPCVVLRAGLIVGAGGSSFGMMKRLVERLPCMICPKWTTTMTQPIALKDVVKILLSVIDDKDLKPGAYDIGGRSVLTYIEMMRLTSLALKRRRWFFTLGVFTPKLSRLWVRLVTGYPKELISPLVESLKHPMVVRNDDLMVRYGIVPSDFESAIIDALSPQKLGDAIQQSKPETLISKKAGNREVNTVCSVQRLPLPASTTAEWVANKYTTWLVDFLYPVIKVERVEDGSLLLQLRFFPFSKTICLLRLRFAADRSSPARQLFFIQDGLLVSSHAMSTGRFEFREVLNGRFVLAAIFDFVPALPWWLYKMTQANLHLFVMRKFQKSLSDIR